MNAYSARVITTLVEWQRLEECWDELLSASHDSTPWQTWAYLLNWWKHMGLRKSLRIIVVERDGKPVLIFPLQLARIAMLGLPIRLLEPISMLWDVNRPRLALGPQDDEAFRCGLAAIWNLRDEWDALRMEELPISDPQAQALAAFSRSHGLWFRHVLSSVCPYLRLDRSWPEFLKSRGNRLRKNLRAAERKLGAHGVVSVEACVTPAQVAAGLDLMLDLHQRSWKSRKRVGLSHSRQYQTFFREFVADMAARGNVRILVLRTGAQPVAATLAFLHRDTYFSTEIVHDATFKACSPGTLLESYELEQLMTERRFGQYDFLGRFLNNKQRWTDEARVTHRLYVFRKSLINTLLEFHYFRAKPAIKRVWRSAFGLSRATLQAAQFVAKDSGPAG